MTTAPGGPAGLPRVTASAPTRWRLWVAITLVAVNLRPAVVSVGPVLDDIRLDLGLSASAASWLTALPILCFGIAALIAPRVARRLGTERSLVLVMALTAAGLALRLGPTTLLLFSGTLLAGAAIAVGNVLVPAVIKGEAESSGPLMGLYVSTMTGSAAISAAVTVPVAELAGGSWRIGLGVWAIPALVAAAFWAGMARRGKRVEASRPAPVKGSLLRDPLAWQVTAFMGMQSLVFYAVLSWLPSVYRSYGVGARDAGLLLALLTIVGVPVSLVVPRLAARAPHQRWWAVGATAMTVVGLCALLIAPTAYPVLWAVLIGVGTGAAFPLALTLVVLRSADMADAGRLSAMSQSAGYLLAAAGPAAFGVLHDLTGGWRISIGMLIVLLAVQMACGLGAGRSALVGERS